MSVDRLRYPPDGSPRLTLHTASRISYLDIPRPIEEVFRCGFKPQPGLSVPLDCLEPLGLTVTEAARRLGGSRERMSDVINLRLGISPEMAIRLDKTFGGGAKAWHLLQADCDLARAMKVFDNNGLKAMRSSCK